MTRKTRIISRPMSPQKQQKARRALEKSIKYDMFTPFTDGSDDNAILDLSDSEFSQMTKVFNNRIEFFDAITLAEKHISNGQDVPTELWDKIQQTRQDYSSYRW